MKVGQKVAIGCIVADWTVNFLLGETRRPHLLRNIYESTIKEALMMRLGMVGFEIEITYKSGMSPYIRTLFSLKIDCEISVLLLCLKLNSMSKPDWEELFS